MPHYHVQRPYISMYRSVSLQLIPLSIFATASYSFIAVMVLAADLRIVECAQKARSVQCFATTES